MRTRIIRAVSRLAILALVMVVLMSNSSLVFAQSSTSVPSNWAKADISRAKENKIIPDSMVLGYKTRITREEFSEIAVKLYEALAGYKVVLQGANPFVDTKNTSVRIANELGIVKGRGKGIFAPYDMITRQEISVILYRTLQASKPGNNYAFNYDYVFIDDYQIASWAKGAVGYLYGVGVINGVGYDMFDPMRNTSKEEAIVLAQRLHDKVLSSNGNLIVSRSGINRRQTVLRAQLAEYLSKEMGKPYQWGGTGPNSYDCSGLVYVVYGKLGISLPRVSRDQARVGTYVDKANLEYGDLVFFAKDGRTVSHVGIYVGNGDFVHAPQTGDVVKRSPLMTGYYLNTYYSARRVIN